VRLPTHVQYGAVLLVNNIVQGTPKESAQEVKTGHHAVPVWQQGLQDAHELRLRLITVVILLVPLVQKADELQTTRVPYASVAPFVLARGPLKNIVALVPAPDRRLVCSSLPPGTPTPAGLQRQQTPAPVSINPGARLPRLAHSVLLSGRLQSRLMKRPCENFTRYVACIHSHGVGRCAVARAKTEGRAGWTAAEYSNQMCVPSGSSSVRDPQSLTACPGASSA
jgi:hypothetical protein